MTQSSDRRATFDERRARALLTRRLFGRDAAEPIRLERYLVSERLGSGANGVVYKAWDPVLRRDVALKLLRRTVEVSRGVGSQALVEESRRCARLEHPNVGAIFSVGRASDPQAWFIVMELLTGPTLRTWAADPGRSELELCEALEAAARGLDVAHAHGVVHGDFKPDNAMFGADGVLRVVDFGGQGTPRYTAPEVRAGSRPTVRADVYAYAVTVEEVWGERPKSPRLARALALALSPSPDERPASASAVADALPRRRRGPWVLGVALALPIALGAWVMHTAEEPCEVEALGAPTALRGDVEDAAAAFTETWNRARAAHCEAPSEALLRCLEQTRLRWESVVALAPMAEDEAQTARVLRELPTPATCLEGPTEDASALRSTFRELEIEIHVTEDLGLWHERGPQLRRRLEEIRALASGLRDDAVEADAALYAGTDALARGAIDVAHRDFESAYLLGTRAGDASTAFFAAANLVRLSVDILEDPVAARRWLAAAEHAAARRDVADARGDMLAERGRVALALGDAEQSVRHFEAAKAAYGHETRLDAWVEVYCGLGKAYRMRGEVESALAEFEAGLRYVASVQAHERDTRHHMCLLNGKGTAARILGQLEVSRGALKRLHALMVRESPESPDVFAVLGNLAQLEADAGEHQQALARFRQVREGFEQIFGPRSPVVAQTHYAIAEQLFALHRDEEARSGAQAALRWSAPEPAASAARLLLARIEARAGREAEARAEVEALLAEDALPDEVRQAAETVAAELR